MIKLNLMQITDIKTDGHTWRTYRVALLGFGISGSKSAQVCSVVSEILKDKQNTILQT